MRKFDKTLHRVQVNISGIKLILTVYFLAYGLFGYGSSVSLERPVTILPMISGILLGMLVLIAIRSGIQDWNFTLRFKLADVLTFSLVFCGLLLQAGERIGWELTNDELSYVQLSHIHSIEFLSLTPLAVGYLDSGVLIRITSAVFLVFSTLILWWGIWKRPAFQGAIFTFVGTLAFQIVFAILGGWGWGYTKSAWIPYLFGTTIFGLTAEGFRLTSVAIVALGLTLLFNRMRTLGVRQEIASLMLLGLLFMGAPSLFFPVVDHVLFFVAFAIPSIVFLVHRSTGEQFQWLITFLSIGVTFRVTVAFVLVAVLLGGLFSGEFRKTMQSVLKYSLPIALLTPYFIGTLLNPAVPVGPVETSNLSATDRDWKSVVTLVDAQLGVVPVLVVVSGLLLAVILRQNVLIPVVYILICSFFYFVAITNLVGEFKYSVEWAWSFTLLGMILWELALRRHKLFEATKLVVPGLVLVTNFVPPIFSESRISLEEARVAHSPLGYSLVLRYLGEDGHCQPVGVTYGAGIEITNGLSWESVIGVKNAYSRYQAAISLDERLWSKAYSDIAFSQGLSCLYGTFDSFHGLEDGDWSDWEIAFLTKLPDSRTSVVVLKQSKG